MDSRIADFEGARDLLRAWSRGIRPDPDLTVSEWADRHRWLSSRASAEPGRYRTARTPYMREIMDRLSPGDPVQRVVFMKSAQVGATEGGNCFIGFVMHHAPGPMLAVQPTVELAKRNSRQRIDPLIDESPELRERVKPARSRDAGNTMLSKEFAGGILIMTGANSAVGLRSTPARYIFLDEVDAYPASADEEGDPVTLAEARSLTFAHRRKVFLVSTPTIRGLSRIEREFEASDQRRFFVPCPHCGADAVAEVRAAALGEGPARRRRNITARAARQPIAEHHKTAMLEAGEWRATATAADPSTVGYHLSALYSPIGWLSWERIVRAWDAAQGSDEAIKAFRNTILGETWVETGEAPDWQRLADRREAWAAGTVPGRGLFLTAGADVQKDRIEVDVWAWGRGLESWLVDHLVLEGGPGDPACWQALTDLLGRTWEHASGQPMTLARLAIDTGYETSAVYAWSRQAGFAQVAPVKGVEGFNRTSPVTGPTYVDATVAGKRLRRGARLWTVATSTFKAETYRFLRQDRPTREERADGASFPPGTIHLPDWADGEWLKQLTAEQLVTVKTRRGFARLEWQKLRERNEALDCRVYARAAAWILGADRWSEARWADLEAQLGATAGEIRMRPPRRREPCPRASPRDGGRCARATCGEALSVPWPLAGAMAFQGTAPPGGEILEDHANVALLDVVGVEGVAAPGEHAVVLLVVGIRHGLEELREAAGAADILRRRAAGTRDEAGILGVRLALPDVLDRDAVLPVVAEVVDVEELAHAPVDQRSEADALRLVDRALEDFRLGIGDAVDLLAHHELVEVAVLPAHGDLDEVVQRGQRGRQRHVEHAPDHRDGAFEFDADAGDGFRHGRPRMATARA